MRVLLHVKCMLPVWGKIAGASLLAVWWMLKSFLQHAAVHFDCKDCGVSQMLIALFNCNFPGKLTQSRCALSCPSHLVQSASSVLIVLLSGARLQLLAFVLALHSVQ